MGSKEMKGRELVEILKEYFEKRDDILMAFLFGSIAKATTHRESDVDIAIYLRPEENILEWEKFDAKYDAEGEIWLDIERLLHRNVDLIVLNRARSWIANSAIHGRPIIVKDRGLYLDFMLRVTSEAEDYREMVEDYWKIKQAAHG
jgi:predicted nucleotidyltransferase